MYFSLRDEAKYYIRWVGPLPILIPPQRQIMHRVLIDIDYLRQAVLLDGFANLSHSK